MNTASPLQEQKTTKQQSRIGRVRTALKDRAVQIKLQRIASNIFGYASIPLFIGGFVGMGVAVEIETLRVVFAVSFVSAVLGGAFFLLAYAVTPIEDKWADACDYVGP